MGRKKKGNRQQVVVKPWCFYCWREFESEDPLIAHQQLKHFKCQLCAKKCKTLFGLIEHMTGVHKQPLERSVCGRVVHGVRGADSRVVPGCPTRATATTRCSMTCWA